MTASKLSPTRKYTATTGRTPPATASPAASTRSKAKRLFQQWLDSWGHRHNLMNPTYGFVATGAVARGHHLYAVQEFWER